MQETLISFKTAKLAKEKGFNWKCLGNYHVGRINGKLNVVAIKTYEQDWNNYKEPNRTGYLGKKTDQGQLTTSAPTQSLLQKWLREVHGIDLCFGTLDKPNKYHVEDITKDDKIIGGVNIGSDTYEKALELGLQEALKLIKL